MTPALARGGDVTRRDRHLRAQRTSALAGLKVLDALDLPRWKSALATTRPSGYAYYFPFVLAHQRPGRSSVLAGEDAGSLCTFLLKDDERGAHVDLFLPPMPMDVAVTRRCLDRANEFNGDRTARILRIDASDAAILRGVPGFSVRERRSQYLYAPRAFGELAGGKYRTLRYHVSRVRRRAGLEVVPYEERYAAECRALLDRWSERYRREHGSSGDAGLSKRALALTRELGGPDLVGELVLLDGRVTAFAFGGEIHPGLACLFESKADLDVPGLTHFQCWSFISKMDAFERVNGGSDARRAGIAQLKESLRPVGMHLEHRAAQVAP